MRELDGEVKVSFATVSSYSGKSSGEISYASPNLEDISNSNVIIVEDIVDTGKTLDFLINQVKLLNPKTLQTCVLLDKPSRREIPVTIDYLGHTIQDLFVVGYGMDFKDRFRNLPYIGVPTKITLSPSMHCPNSDSKPPPWRTKEDKIARSNINSQSRVVW